jgi:hypothetical protein
MSQDVAIKNLETTINKLRICKELVKSSDPKVHGILGNSIGELKKILVKMTEPNFNYSFDNDPVIKAYLEQKKIWRDY